MSVYAYNSERKRDADGAPVGPRGGCGGGLGFNADVRSLTRISLERPANGFSPQELSSEIEQSLRPLPRLPATTSPVLAPPLTSRGPYPHPAATASCADDGRSLTSTAPGLRRCIYIYMCVCRTGDAVLYIRTILVTVIIITPLRRTTICYV